MKLVNRNTIFTLLTALVVVLYSEPTHAKNIVGFTGEAPGKITVYGFLGLKSDDHKTAQLFSGDITVEFLQPRNAQLSFSSAKMRLKQGEKSFTFNLPSSYINDGGLSVDSKFSNQSADLTAKIETQLVRKLPNIRRGNCSVELNEYVQNLHMIINNEQGNAMIQLFPKQFNREEGCN